MTTLEALPYHEALAAGHLLLQACGDCGALRHPPSPMCPCCQSVNVRWQRSAGAGAVHSAVTVHHTTTPAYRERTPYTVLTVALDDGVRLLAPLDFDAQAVPPIGARVALHFAPQTDGSLLPLFKTVP
ncbi:Zn-ribbon domain-containing OB-fold protein [Acidovorax sp. SDU_ACID1]|jgi:uncharacterized OB-fold protein|uniref:Zn-ribbon domain-containing OB-fold protein n=1 Tax=Acidovorax sp. SDU_ACID1 TaxID=3136632 RepID=UPI003872EA87